MTHPVIALEAELKNYIKQKIANVALWLLYHLPHRFKVEMVMFPSPTVDAPPDAFAYNGVSFAGGSLFVGIVKHTPMQMTVSPVGGVTVAKTRIVKP